jgi:hypothetical protein
LKNKILKRILVILGIYSEGIRRIQTDFAKEVLLKIALARKRPGVDETRPALVAILPHCVPLQQVARLHAEVQATGGLTKWQRQYPEN